MSTGVLLTRAQPLHAGHVKTLKKILSENEKALLIIGSANKEGTKRNPFPVVFRTEMVKKAIEYYLPKEIARINIICLNDWSMENYKPAVKEWGNYLYYSIVYNIGEKSFNLYYNDDPNIVKEWFDDTIKERINICSTNRIDVENGISATEIRNAILKDDYRYMQNHFLQYISEDDFDKMKSILKTVEKKEKEDFIMN